jgi:SNF family Na+-dependent transporter
MPASAGILFFQTSLGFSHSIMVSANTLRKNELVFTSSGQVHLHCFNHVIVAGFG